MWRVTSSDGVFYVYAVLEAACVAGNLRPFRYLYPAALEAACVAGNRRGSIPAAARLLEAACVAGNRSAPGPLFRGSLEAACVAGNGTKNLRNGPGTGLQGSYLEKPMLLELLRQLPDY